MVAANYSIRNMPIILVVGAASVAAVIVMGVLRYVSAAEPTNVSYDDTRTITDSSVLEAPLVMPMAEDSAVPQPTVNASDQTGSTAPGSESTASGSVTVNGQTYTVPSTGELHTTTSNADGNATIDISVQSSGSGQNFSSSSSNVQMHSSSYNINQSTGSTSQ